MRRGACRAVMPSVVAASRQRAIGQWFPAADARLASIAEPDELVERDLRLLRPVGSRHQPFTHFPLLPTFSPCQFLSSVLYAALERADEPSEERRAGQVYVRTGRTRWEPQTIKKKRKNKERNEKVYR